MSPMTHILWHFQETHLFEVCHSEELQALNSGQLLWNSPLRENKLLEPTRGLVDTKK